MKHHKWKRCTDRRECVACGVVSVDVGRYYQGHRGYCLVWPDGTATSTGRYCPALNGDGNSHTKEPTP